MARSKLRELIKNNIPSGFEETINYAMIGYEILRSLSPSGIKLIGDLGSKVTDEEWLKSI